MKTESNGADHPDQRRQADHPATSDRKASHGDDYAHDNNRSAEGNDAALTSGPAFERRVHADGSVEDGDPAAADSDDAATTQRKRNAKDR